MLNPQRILGLAALLLFASMLVAQPVLSDPSCRIDDRLEHRANENPDTLRRILLWTSPAEAALDVALRAGVSDVNQTAGWVGGFANRQVLAALAQDDRVRLVEAPLVARKHASGAAPPTEGVLLTGAAAQHALNNRGLGVKVCVVDVEFDQFQNAVNAGTIPNNVTTQSFVPAPGGGVIPFEAPNDGPHGTSCLKIVHDMAPQATLFAARVASAQDLHNAVTWALAQGCAVISASIGFDAGNFWGAPGELTHTTIQNIHAAGALPVFAAGNNAEVHQDGLFVDANNDGNMDWPGGVNELPVIVPTVGGMPPTPVTIFLSWDNWPLSTVNYDIEVRDAGGAFVAATATPAGGPARDDLEVLVPAPVGTAVNAPVDVTINVRVKITNLPMGAAHRRVKVFVSQPASLAPALQRPEGSLILPACVPECLSVGAMELPNWPFGNVASYSSRGPSAQDPTRAKPDLVAPSAVTDPFYPQGFNGTSASTPHVAGAAALLLALEPSLHSPLRVGTLRSFVLGFADAWGLPVPLPTQTFGHGRLHVPAQILNGYTGSTIAIPAIPLPGQGFTIFVVGGSPFAPVTLAADLTTTTNGGAYIPLAFPFPAAAIHTPLMNILPLIDGLALFGGPPGNLDAVGMTFFPLARPNPGLGINAIHVQAIWLTLLGQFEISTPLVIDI